MAFDKFYPARLEKEHIVTIPQAHKYEFYCSEWDGDTLKNMEFAHCDNASEIKDILKTLIPQFTRIIVKNGKTFHELELGREKKRLEKEIASERWSLSSLESAYEKFK